jgi:polyferredoxin
MDKMNYPRGLVRYTTDNAMAAGQPPRVIRPRILVYAALLALLAGGFVYGVANRSPIIVEVIRDRNSIYREIRGGLVENVYSLKIVNKTDADQALAVSAGGFPGIRLIVDSEDLSVPAGAVRRLPVRIQVPAADAPDGAADVVVRIEGGDGEQPFTVERTSRFIGPSS